MTAIYRQHGELFIDRREFLCKVYAIGWVNFNFFSNVMHLHVVCPGYNWGNAKFFFNFGSKTRVGNLLIDFLSNLLVFCEQNSNKAICS